MWKKKAVSQQVDWVILGLYIMLKAFFFGGERVGRAMIIIQNSSVKGNEQSVNESKFHSSIDVLNFI